VLSVGFWVRQCVQARPATGFGLAAHVVQHQGLVYVFGHGGYRYWGQTRVPAAAPCTPPGPLCFPWNWSVLAQAWPMVSGKAPDGPRKATRKPQCPLHRCRGGGGVECLKGWDRSHRNATKQGLQSFERENLTARHRTWPSTQERNGCECHLES